MKDAFNSKAKCKVVADCISTKVQQVYFHDVIAVYAWLCSNEVKVNKGNIEVLYTDDCVLTNFSNCNNGNHFLVADFSAEKFFINYVDTLKIRVKDKNLEFI